MDSNKFTKEDKEKVIEFLNLVAKHARFDMNTQELIAYFKSLSFMQQVLLPKVEANILEVMRVVESENAEEASDAEESGASEE